MLEVRLLGRFELRQDGNSVVLPSRPAQSLLAYLVLSAGTAHRREKLAGLFWPDADEDNARKSLRHALWRIRKVLEPQPGNTTYLLADELAVSFDAGADYWLDVAALTRDGDALQDRIESVAVYGGELLPGFYDDWVALERDRLASVFQTKMQRLLDRLIEDRRWPEVLDWAERWVALGHAPEPGYRALMRAHAEAGDRSRVAAVFQRCREALFNELGVQPSLQTRRLYEQLCRDDPQAGLAPIAPTRSQAEEPAPGEPPFQGLQFFDEADADRFFGRERLTARLLARLRTEPFLAVLGSSGTGKSSVVRAGLVPALRRRDGLAGAVRVLTPTAQPLSALAASVGSHGERALLLEELARDPHGLRRFLKRQRRQVTLVVDQFEELFTLCPDSFEREAFSENLLAAAELDGPATVVVALRADFYAHCAESTRLREAVARHQEYVGLMAVSELRRAIEGPVELGSWELEPGLVDLLVRDVGEEPGALPLLSHALLETWQRRRGRRLTLAGYTASGGVRGAIAQTAETVFTARFDANQQAIARRVFVRLTELGEGTQDTRRRASLAELVHRPHEAQEVRTVLRVLADARLVTLGEETAEVAHEAVIREWSRLREWLGQDRENLRTQRRLSTAAGEWERLGHDPGSLYRGAQLTQAAEWADQYRDELGPVERAFLHASQQTAEYEATEREAQRQRELDAARQLAEAEQRRAEGERERADEQRRTARQLRQRAVLLSLAFAIALVMAGAAAYLGDTARHQAASAAADARAAVSRELAAAALTNLSVDPERAALLALQAVEVTYSADHSWTREAEDALHRVIPLLRAQLTLVGHTGRVLSVAFSPDGRRVATAGQDGTARMWDAFSGRAELTLTGHTAPVNAVAFSPDGTVLATASDDRGVRIWDAASGQQRLVLAGFTREVERLAFSPDGTWLATSSLDGSVSVWDPVSGGNVLTFQPGRTAESGVAIDVTFSPDGAHLATVIPQGEVSEWDLSSIPPGLVRSRLASETSATAHTVAFSPDGTRVAATTDTGAQVWWTATGEPAVNIVGHAISILHAAFSPDGTRFASASLDQTARLWDARSGRELMALTGHQAGVAQVAFGPDGQRLATASWDGTAKVWDLAAAHEVLTLPARGTLVSVAARLSEAPLAGQVAVSLDGTRLLTGLADGTARVWDARTGQEVLTLRGHASQVLGVAIGPDGTRLATAGVDRTVRMWDAASGNALWTATGHADRVVAVAFSPDGTRLASASADRTMRVWDVTSGTQLLALTDADEPLSSLAFSPDGSQLATATGASGNYARVWDTRSGTLLRTLTGHRDAIWSIAFSPGGSRIVTASRDGSARIWDAAGGQSLLTLQSHAGNVVSAVFSPDGRRVATGSRDGTLQVWDASTGQEVLALAATDLGDGVDGVVFSADDRQLVVRTDQAVRTFALSIDDLVALARSRLTRSWAVEECQRFLHVDHCPASSAQPAAGRQAEAAAPLARQVRAPVVQVPGSGLSGTIKVLSSMSRTGTMQPTSDMVVQAYRMALEEHHHQIGGATVSLEDLNDSQASQGYWDAPTEAANANRAVNDPDVLVYLGPSLSAAARVSIPLLCPAQLAIVSFSTTYPGLTRPSRFNGSGEPETYYPNCARNFARVVPADDLQGAAAAQFARQHGVRTVYVLHDGGLYGQGLAAIFAATASKVGLQVVGGPEGMDPSAGDYRALAETIRLSHPDLVYFGGLDASNAGKLWQDLRAALGMEVMLMGADGINEDAFIHVAGSAAEGTYATFPGVPAEKLSGKGADWYQRYKQQFQQEPGPYVAYGYEAMNVALAAIQRVGKRDRAAIRDAIFATRDYDGVLGKWSFTDTGDTTLKTMSVRQVRNGAWDKSTVQVIEAPP